VKLSNLFASNVKGWAGNWDAVYDNILLRAKIKDAIVSASDKAKNPKTFGSRI